MCKINKNKNTNKFTNTSHITKITKFFILVGLIIVGLGYVYFFKGGDKSFYLMLATTFAVYLLINIGANDIANNMGPAVGAKAITLKKALFIAAVFEALGAIIAGGEVVNTIQSGVINSENITEPNIFIIIMLSTLLGSAIWINIATVFKAPVSTTNSVIGGLVGAGIAAAGFEIVKWGKIGEIALSWVISILMGGIIAVIVYQSIRYSILKRPHKGKSARIWVPIYIGAIGAIFSTYLLIKGLKPLLQSNEFLGNIFTPVNSTLIGIIVGFVSYILIKNNFNNRKKAFFEDDKNFVNKLFNPPLVVAVSLLCFAHGSNDVANAVGPLAGIYDKISTLNGEIASSNQLWIMIIGGVGLATGLSIFGSKIIKTVGKNITKIDQVRAFCIAVSTATTVLIASALGFPVSSTQIALGAIFGIGFFRMYLNYKKGKEKEALNISFMKGILLSWVVTLPFSALISALTYFVIMKFFA